MKFQNDSGCAAALFRIQFATGRMGTAVFARVRLRLSEDGGLLPFCEADQLTDIRRNRTDDPYGAIEPDLPYPRTETDVIVFADALSRVGPTIVTKVGLEVGPYVHDLLVFGDRVWGLFDRAAGVTTPLDSWGPAMPTTSVMTKRSRTFNPSRCSDMSDSLEIESVGIAGGQGSEPQTLLRSLFDEPSTSPSTWVHDANGGYRIELRESESDSSHLRLVSPTCYLCVKIHFDPGGPRIEIHGASLYAHARDTLRLEAAVVEVRAQQALELVSGGSIRQRAVTSIESEAFEHQFESTHGEIRLIANDDVAIDGEHIRLNSPPVPVPDHLRAVLPPPRETRVSPISSSPEAHEVQQ